MVSALLFVDFFLALVSLASSLQIKLMRDRNVNEIDLYVLRCLDELDAQFCFFYGKKKNNTSPNLRNLMKFVSIFVL